MASDSEKCANSTGFAKTKDRSAEVENINPQRLLVDFATCLKRGSRDPAAHLSISIRGDRLIIVYHQIVVLHWQVIDRVLVCTPIGWRYGAYTASDCSKARKITIRLLFDFAKQLHFPYTER
jgi:hypothetical protein